MDPPPKTNCSLLVRRQADYLPTAMPEESMKPEKLFPTILMVLDLCAAAGYLSCGDWRRVGYWLAACALTFFVTY